MTAHLHETEFVDLLDGTLMAARRQHIEECQACRDTAAALAEAIAVADYRDVPEPSPLFWEHFSARVRSAIDEEPLPSRAWRYAPVVPSMRWAMIATTAALVLALAIWRAGVPSTNLATGPAPQTALEHAPARDLMPLQAFDDLDADEAWAVVRSVADELDLDEIDAAGLGTRPGSVERVANALSEIERIELAELIEHEIKASKAAGPSS